MGSNLVFRCWATVNKVVYCLVFCKIYHIKLLEQFEKSQQHNYACTYSDYTAALIETKLEMLELKPLVEGSSHTPIFNLSSKQT